MDKLSAITLRIVKNRLIACSVFRLLNTNCLPGGSNALRLSGRRQLTILLVTSPFRRSARSAVRPIDQLLTGRVLDVDLDPREDVRAALVVRYFGVLPCG